MSEMLDVPSSSSKKGRPTNLNVQISSQRKASAASPAISGSFEVTTFQNDQTEDTGPSNSIIYKAYIPEEASNTEKRIHSYLDGLFAFTVDIKSKLETDLNQIAASPQLKSHFL